jgi:hypothetical protein
VAAVVVVAAVAVEQRQHHQKHLAMSLAELMRLTR